MSHQSSPLMTVTVRLAGACTRGRLINYQKKQAIPGEVCLGVSVADGKVNEQVQINVLGSATVQTGGIFAAGDPLASDASGQVVLFTGAGYCVGRAMEPSTVSGQFVEMLLNTTAQENQVNAIKTVTGRIEVLAGSVIDGTIYNFDPKNYKNARAALADVKAGLGHMNVLCLGDSTTAGVNESGNANEVASSWVRRLSDQMTSSGIPSSWQNVMGDHACNNSGGLPDTRGVATLDTRVGALSANWGPLGGSTGLALGFNLFMTNTVDQITFTPSGSTDTLELFYVDQPGYAAISAFGGAAGATASTPATVVPAGDGRIKSAVFTCAGTSVWKFGGAGGANIILIGWKAYNAATKEISFLNCGNHSQKSSQPLSGPQYYSALKTITDSTSALKSPLAFYSFGINEWLNNYSAAQTLANIQGLIAPAQAVGTDVVLIVPPPSPTSLATDAAQQAQIASIYAAASQYNCAVIDLSMRWGSQAVSYPLNMYAGPGDVHPSKRGYADIASAVRRFMIAL